MPFINYIKAAGGGGTGALTWYYGERTSSSAAPSGNPKTQHDLMVAALSGTPTAEGWESFDVEGGLDVVTSTHDGGLTIDWTLDDNGGFNIDFGAGLSITNVATNGRFNTTSGGDRWPECALPLIGTPSASVAYWGAYLTDVGDFSPGAPFAIEITDDADNVVTYTFTPSSTDTGLIFVGFIDPTGTKYKRIRLAPTGEEVFDDPDTFYTFSDGYGMDDVIAGVTV